MTGLELGQSRPSKVSYSETPIMEIPVILITVSSAGRGTDAKLLGRNNHEHPESGAAEDRPR